ncbi:hypothetical protein ACFW6V_25770 [Streptomyces sp. NPDC058734]|uniref:hypothetical protein n=1 Tax=Streptomyces sp. NPDC058734 TaxID=3346615 RepID=UPI00368ED44B
MATEPEFPRTLPRKIKDHVGWWLAAAGALAGIIALYFAIKPPPPPETTITEWRLAAQSVCAINGGPAITKFTRARKAMQDLVDSANRGDWPDQKTITAAGEQYEDAGNAISEFIGHLREIKQPPDYAKRINDALDLGSDIGTTMAGAGRSIRDRETDKARNGLLFISANATVWGRKMDEVNVCRGGMSPSPQHSS